MFPLLLIPFAIVNITAFLMPDTNLWQTVAYTLVLPSLEQWRFTYGDVLVAFGMFLLIFEIAKAARPGAKYFTDHLLSFLVFAGATAEFVMLRPFGHSTFMLLTVLAGVDFVAGIVIRSRRPKVVAQPAYVPAAPAPAPVPPAQPVRPDPVAEPMPNPAVTPAVTPAPAAPAPGGGPVAVRPANDLEIIPPKDVVATGVATPAEPAAGEKRSDEPTVIPQR